MTGSWVVYDDGWWHSNICTAFIGTVGQISYWNIILFLVLHCFWNITSRRLLESEYCYRQSEWQSHFKGSRHYNMLISKVIHDYRAWILSLHDSRNYMLIRSQVVYVWVPGMNFNSSVNVWQYILQNIRMSGTVHFSMWVKDRRKRNLLYFWCAPREINDLST